MTRAKEKLKRIVNFSPETQAYINKLPDLKIGLQQVAKL